MTTSSFNSQQFVMLLQQGGSGYLSGNCRFETLHSGISLHGGSFCAEKDFRSSRLTEPYISFVLLLEGSLDFAINCHRYHIEAGSGRIILVALAEEALFSRYLHRGCRTVKLAVKGLEQWLNRPPYQHLLPAVYRESVRHWQMPEHIKPLVAENLSATGSTHLGDTLQREAAALALLAALWQDFNTHHLPENPSNDIPTMPSESFQSRLNQAFAQGIHQVAELAAALHISERTLQRRSKESFGITASEWLRHKNMQYALYALSTKQASISEIAYRCGYRHVSSFTQAFRLYFGHTPAEIRRQEE